MNTYTITHTTSLHTLGDMKRRIKKRVINYCVKIVKNALIKSNLTIRV